MSIKILTQNSIDNTNIDGARANHFNAGQKSGIVKGAFNEGRFFSSSSNTIALDTCELRICGHQVVIDEVQYKTMFSKPLNPTRYSYIAQIIVDDHSNPTFELFVQDSDISLIQNNLYKTLNGTGTYQIEIGRFTLTTLGTVEDLTRTIDIINGGSSGIYGDYIRIGEVKTNTTASGTNANVDIENIETESGLKTNFTFDIPAPIGTTVSVDGIKQSNLVFKANPQGQLDAQQGQLDAQQGQLNNFNENLNMQGQNIINLSSNIEEINNRKINDKTFNEDIIFYGNDIKLSSDNAGGLTDAIIGLNAKKVSFDLIWSGNNGTNGTILTRDLNSYDMLFCSGRAWEVPTWCMLVPMPHSSVGNGTNGERYMNQINSGTDSSSVKGTSFFVIIDYNSSNYSLKFTTGYDNTISNNSGYLCKIYGIKFGG